METSTLHYIMVYLSGVITPFIVWYIYDFLNPEEDLETRY